MSDDKDSATSAEIKGLEADVKALVTTVGDLAVKMEGVHGEVKTLNTVFGMARSEQKQFNNYAIENLGKQDDRIQGVEKTAACVPLLKKTVKAQGEKTDKLHAKVYYLSGFAAVAGIAIKEFFQRLFFGGDQ